MSGPSLTAREVISDFLGSADFDGECFDTLTAAARILDRLRSAGYDVIFRHDPPRGKRH